MDVITFHKAFLGRDPNRTPLAYRLTDLHQTLYEQFPTARGFSLVSAEVTNDPKSKDLFLATLILALAQTRPGKQRRIYLFAPKQHTEWAKTQIEGVVRHAARERKGDAFAIRIIREIFQQLTLTHKFLQMEEPAHWVAFALHRDVPGLPDWLRDALIEVSGD